MNEGGGVGLMVPASRRPPGSPPQLDSCCVAGLRLVPMIVE